MSLAGCGGETSYAQRTESNWKETQNKEWTVVSLGLDLMADSMVSLPLEILQAKTLMSESSSECMMMNEIIGSVSMSFDSYRGRCAALAEDLPVVPTKDVILPLNKIIATSTEHQLVSKSIVHGNSLLYYEISSLIPLDS